MIPIKFLLSILLIKHKRSIMKSIIYTISIITLFAFCFCACNQNNNLISDPENDNNLALIEEAEYLGLPVDIVKDLTPEAKQSRISSFIMAEHIYLDGFEQRIDISEQEALALGVPAHHYNYAVNYLKTLNEVTKRMIENGEAPNTIDIKKHVRDMKKRKYYYPTTNIKSNLSRGSARPDYLQGDLISDYGTVDSLKLIAWNKEATTTFMYNEFDIEKTRNDYSAYPVIIIIESKSPVNTITDRKKIDFDPDEWLKGGNITTAVQPSQWDHSFTYKFTCLGALGCLFFTQQ